MGTKDPQTLTQTHKHSVSIYYYDDLNSIFVDDISIVPTVTIPGMVYENEELKYDENKVDNDKKIPDDERTMILIQLIANSLDTHIKVTYDCPSKHTDRYVPILVLKVKVNTNKKNRVKILSKNQQ